MGASGGDPVALGLAKSLPRPGFNVTGTFFLSGLSDKRLQLLKQAFPAAQRVAILANPKGAISVLEMPKAEMAASRIDLHLVSLAASTPAELRALAPAALSGSEVFSLFRTQCSGITAQQSSTLHLSVRLETC
jgi:ABC-type uncharacterized transport system substrate-binding protein